MIQNAIHTTNLSKTFGSIRAVDQLSLEVPSGMIFGFLGPNGAGKTTTIRLLLGLLEPTGGKAEVLGFDTRRQSELIRARTGALLEHAGLYEQLSAEDNLEFYGRVYQMPAMERKARIQELLEQSGLWERRKEPVKLWSRGMKQKLAIARTLLHKPALVLLDEPTAGLDVKAAVEVRASLAGLASSQGVTIFLTTHNMTEAENLCNRLAVIRDGKLIAQGHPDELRARTGKPRLEIQARGLTDTALASLQEHPQITMVEKQNGRLVIGFEQELEPGALVQLLVKAGVQVDEVQRSQASLEEVYLTLFKEEA